MVRIDLPKGKYLPKSVFRVCSQTLNRCKTFRDMRLEFVMSIKTNFKELSEEGCTAMQCAEALDEIVELKGLRAALTVSISVYGLFLRLEERLVHKFVNRSDNHRCTALSDLIECAEFVGMYRSSFNVHSKMRSHCLEGHVGD